MTDSNNHTTDTPPEWDRYAEMLRRQPPRPVPGEHAAGMMPRIDLAIAARARRARIVRWAAAPSLAAVALLLILLVRMGSFQAETPSVRRASAPSVQTPKDRPRIAHRAPRRRLTPPPVPIEDVPATVDMAPMERVAPPDMAHEEPIGPGPGFSHSADAQATPRP
jgi:hypothetical protein